MPITDTGQRVEGQTVDEGGKKRSVFIFTLTVCDDNKPSTRIKVQQFTEQ